MTPTDRTVNRALATSRAPVERGMARLKSWRIFRRSRCSPNRMTSIAKAVLTLERQRRKRSVERYLPLTGRPQVTCLTVRPLPLRHRPVAWFL
ncbi:transposase family protein [Streptomyces sp. NPDC087901]|uniref:transposase family protein n=1 Tax=Streptomyces sp. NPDC087901 TaxID=3365818 RepID=UPI00382E8FD0